jgi:hypothetical protein
LLLLCFLSKAFCMTISNQSSVFGFCFMLIELLRLCFWSKAFCKYYVIFLVGHHLSNSIQVALNHMEILWRLMKTYDLAKRDLSHQESVIIGLYLLDSNVPCKMSHHKGLVQVSLGHCQFRWKGSVSIAVFPCIEGSLSFPWAILVPKQQTNNNWLMCLSTKYVVIRFLEDHHKALEGFSLYLWMHLFRRFVCQLKEPFVL